MGCGLAVRFGAAVTAVLIAFGHDAMAADDSVSACADLAKKVHRACELKEAPNRCARLNQRFQQSCEFRSLFGFPRFEQLCAEQEVGKCRWSPYDLHYYIQHSLCAEDQVSVIVSKRRCLKLN